MARTPYLNANLRDYTETIFAEMSALAIATNSINLGQGFPDTDGPEAVKQAAINAITSGHNQYPPGIGIPELRSAIAQHQLDYYGLTFDPAREIVVTAGASEAIAGAVLGLCEPGDEVVMLEPYFDSYAAVVSLAGAKRRVIPLRPPNWELDIDLLEDLWTPQTRIILLNTPHNPTGKVCTHDELTAIAEWCLRHDVIAVTDEVYEHMVYEGQHLPLATYPGMRERTITISSAAKTFSVTGWKIGWVCGPAELVQAVNAAKQYLTYAGGTPFQHGVAHGLFTESAYIKQLATTLQAKRDFIVHGLLDIGLTTYVPQGAFYATSDISSLGYSDALAFCRELPEKCGVVAIPSSVFFDDKPAGKSLVRWTFCKRDEVLREAIDRLSTLAR